MTDTAQDVVVVLVINDNHPLDNYLVGTLAAPSLEDAVRYGKGYLCLEHCVKMKLIQDPGSGIHSPVINPIMVCESLWVDLAHYTGLGPLKEPLRSVYLAWRRNYAQHATLFPATNDDPPTTEDPNGDPTSITETAPQ